MVSESVHHMRNKVVLKVFWSFSHSSITRHKKCSQGIYESLPMSTTINNLDSICGTKVVCVYFLVSSYPRAVGALFLCPCWLNKVGHQSLAPDHKKNTCIERKLPSFQPDSWILKMTFPQNKENMAPWPIFFQGCMDRYRAPSSSLLRTSHIIVVHILGANRIKSNCCCLSQQCWFVKLKNEHSLVMGNGSNVVLPAMGFVSKMFPRPCEI